MKAPAIINEDLSHLTARQSESWTFKNLAIFYLPLEAHSLKVPNDALSPFYFWWSFWKKEKKNPFELVTGYFQISQQCEISPKKIADHKKRNTKKSICIAKNHDLWEPLTLKIV